MTTRRLAAILAADVVGFSTMMERDETGTLSAVNSLRHEIIEPSVREHHGRVVKTTGDGFLAEFPSAVDTVRCALAIQERAISGANGRSLTLRIGINLGEILVEEDGDIYGDGVNVAARLEQIADSGGISVSRKVIEEIEGRLDFIAEDRGEQTLKNLTRPVRVYALKPRVPIEAATSNSALRQHLPLPDRPSIAVLPFQNMSGDVEQEYFADGIAEDVITALSRFKSIFVIARNSSFTYKGKAVDVKQVGRDLGVRFVLEGSVRKGGDRVRITGQLIDAATGAHLWADRFDGTLEDVFDLQDKVTEQVVSAIAPRLSQADIERARLKRPENFDGYDHILRAQSTMRPPSQQGLYSALEHLRAAIELLPTHAFACGLAAECYAALDMIGSLADEEKEPREAMQLARRAVDLGADDPEALAAAGFAFACFDSVAASAVLFDAALRLNPNLARAWSLDGFAGLYLAEHDRALKSFERALRLNPLDLQRPTVLGGLATVHFLRGEHEQAKSRAEQSLLERPECMQGLRAMALSAAVLGDRDRASAAAVKLAKLYPKNIDRIRKMMTRREDVDTIVAGLDLAGYPSKVGAV